MRRASSLSGFSRFASAASRLAGRPVAFATAVLIVVLWAASGPLFGFSDTWQLVINTGTTIVTFLMVFLIQSTQYRDTYALQIKLDELIRAMSGAHDALLDLEELDDDQLDRICARYRALARQARADLARGLTDTGVREVEPGRGGTSPRTAESSGADDRHDASRVPARSR